MADERPLVRYEYWKSNPEQGRECWTVYRLNVIGQAWSVATYFTEDIANMVAKVLTTTSEHESVHLHPNG